MSGWAFGTAQMMARLRKKPNPFKKLKKHHAIEATGTQPKRADRHQFDRHGWLKQRHNYIWMFWILAVGVIGAVIFILLTSY